MRFRQVFFGNRRKHKNHSAASDCSARRPAPVRLVRNALIHQASALAHLFCGRSIKRTSRRRVVADCNDGDEYGTRSPLADPIVVCLREAAAASAARPLRMCVAGRSAAATPPRARRGGGRSFAQLSRVARPPRRVASASGGGGGACCERRPRSAFPSSCSKAVKRGAVLPPLQQQHTHTHTHTQVKWPASGKRQRVSS